MMAVGSIWEFYIPSNLAYGDQGSGRDIPPNCPVVFKIKLQAIEDEIE